MNSRICVALALVVAVFLSLTVGCEEKKTYPVTFRCDTDECRRGQVDTQSCPTVPLDAGGCEELPGMFGNPATPVQSGRPEGCVVGLSYGNPYYGDDQQTCSCSNHSGVDGGRPQWSCPI